MPLANGEKKWDFPFHLVWWFASFRRWLCPRGAYAPTNGLTHFTSKCFATIPVLRPNSKNWVSHFTPLVFCMFRAGSVHAVLMRKEWVVHFTTVVFCRTVSLLKSRSELFPGPTPYCNAELSISHGGSSPDRFDSLAVAILAVFDGVQLGIHVCATSERRFR